MPQFTRVLAALGLVLLVVVAADAQDEKQQKKRKKGRQRQNQAVAGLVKRAKTAGVSEEGIAKIQEVGKEYAPKLTEAQKAVAEILGPDARRKQAEARKAAAAEGKKGRELREAIDAALELSPEQKEKLADARQAATKLQREMQAKIRESLSPEDAEKLRPAGKGKNKGAKKKRKKNDDEK